MFLASFIDLLLNFREMKPATTNITSSWLQQGQRPWSQRSCLGPSPETIINASNEQKRGKAELDRMRKNCIQCLYEPLFNAK
jgi:hypothetical protein